MKTMLKTQLVALTAATLGITAYGCGGGGAEATADTEATDETGGGETAATPTEEELGGSGEGEGGGETTGEGEEGEAGSEGSCGAGSCGGK